MEKVMSIVGKTINLFWHLYVQKNGEKKLNNDKNA